MYVDTANKMLRVRVSDNDLKKLNKKCKNLKVTKSRFVKNAIHGDFGKFDIEGLADHPLIKALNSKQGIIIHPDTKKENRLGNLKELLDFVHQNFKQ